LPDSNASQMWIDDASYNSNSSLNETAWIIGFVRVNKTGTYTFLFQTNGNGALFLSTDDSPNNKVLIAAPTSANQSSDITLQNNTKSVKRI
jgi:hypothetical protein